MAFDLNSVLHKDPEGFLKKIKQKPKAVDPNKARDAYRAKGLARNEATLAQVRAGETNPPRGDYYTKDDHNGSAWAFFKVRVGNKIVAFKDKLVNAVPFEHLEDTYKAIAEMIRKGELDDAIRQAFSTGKSSSNMRSVDPNRPKRVRSQETIDKARATRAANAAKKAAAK